jgi:hypothetical protein
MGQRQRTSAIVDQWRMTDGHYTKPACFQCGRGIQRPVANVRVASNSVNHLPVTSCAGTWCETVCACVVGTKAPSKVDMRERTRPSQSRLCAHDRLLSSMVGVGGAPGCAVTCLVHLVPVMVEVNFHTVHVFRPLLGRTGTGGNPATGCQHADRGGGTPSNPVPTTQCVPFRT